MRVGGGQIGCAPPQKIEGGLAILDNTQLNERIKVFQGFTDEGASPRLSSICKRCIAVPPFAVLQWRRIVPDGSSWSCCNPPALREPGAINAYRRAWSRGACRGERKLQRKEFQMFSQEKITARAYYTSIVKPLPAQSFCLLTKPPHFMRNPTGV